MSERPLVTFLLVAYRQEDYIRTACEAALAQTYSPLEIIFSDDCSPDATFDIMQQVVAAYDGPHQVRLSQNEKNIGLIAHVNKGQEMAAGDLVVVAAGDDISLPERTERLVAAWLENRGKAFSFHSDVMRIDMAGNDLERWVPPIAQAPGELSDLALRMSLVIGATHAWDRKIFDVFGPLRFLDAYEDLVIAYRSALLGGIHHVPEMLVKYRVGSGMTTDRSGRQSRQGELQHLLKTLRVKKAVLSQRREDSRAAGREDIMPLIERELSVCLLMLAVYGREAPWWQVMSLAARQGQKWLCLRAYLRRLRKFSWLPAA